MHYHIILTEKCNSECRYCYEKSMQEFGNSINKKFKFDYSAPCFSQVNVKKLKEFLLKDKNPVLVFYGGEPLLQIEKIIDIIDGLKDTNVKFRMQTNGKLLNELPMKYLKKIEKILVSLDGNKERTDFNRGEGTYDLVMKNIEEIKSKCYNGEIIARMTISQDFPDLYEQVLNLIKVGFTSVHWQLDVGFYESDFNEDKIKKFFREYNKSLTKLADWWLGKIKKGNVLKLYPFMGIIESLLKDKPTKIRCGAGHTGYAITTNGKIVACPIMNTIKDFEAGSLEDNPNELKKFEIEECENCEVKDLCGGRCLYWRKAKLWPKKGDEMICDSIKYYISEMKRIFPSIKQLIKEGKISEKDFEYEKYFGPEIIP